MVDEDTNAFNKIMEAFGLPKGSDEEKAARKQAIQDATKGAIQTPLDVMQTCVDSMEVMLEMAKTGLPASISDAGVGVLCARAGVRGAHLNVKINASDLEDKDFVKDVFAKADALSSQAEALENEIMALVEEKL